MKFGSFWSYYQCYSIVLLICLQFSVSIFAIPSSWWSLDILPWKNKFLNSQRELHYCLNLSGFSSVQANLCDKYFDHMPAVTMGAKIGIEECQRQLRYRHWNCSLPHSSDIYGRYTYLATKEAAFAHAISTAGVLHAIARSCKEARLSTCGCSQAQRPSNLHRDWLWGGCGDNLLYAYWFTKNFIDARERESMFRRGSRELANILVNLHNNKAGRMAVYRMSSVACKCHGVSGSCSLRSCWRQLPPFVQISHHITQRYDGSRRVRFNRRGTKLRKLTGRPKKPSENELIYTEISPDFCELGRNYPGFQMSGRECRVADDLYSVGRRGPRSNKASNDLFTASLSSNNNNNHRERAERCSLVCCGRGHRTFTREVHEKCHCRFIWCCKIECQMCIRLEQVHVCN